MPVPPLKDGFSGQMPVSMTPTTRPAPACGPPASCDQRPPAASRPRKVGDSVVSTCARVLLEADDARCAGTARAWLAVRSARRRCSRPCSRRSWWHRPWPARRHACRSDASATSAPPPSGRSASCPRPRGSPGSPSRSRCIRRRGRPRTSRGIGRRYTERRFGDSCQQRSPATTQRPTWPLPRSPQIAKRVSSTQSSKGGSVGRRSGAHVLTERAAMWRRRGPPARLPKSAD